MSKLSRARWVHRLMGFVLAGMLATTGSAVAGDGMIEINQACVAAGCFPGDDPGFPVEITAPGSYVFTSNVTQSTSNVSGIIIQADRVTLDLNGFSLVGPSTDFGAGIELHGVKATVKSGHILDFVRAIVVEEGVEDGHQSKAIGLVISSIGGPTVRLGHNSKVEDCVITITAGGAGILVGRGSHVIGNRLQLAGGQSSYIGIQATAGNATVQNNSVVDAGGHGIDAGGTSIISGNNVSASGLSGIRSIGGSNLVERNTVDFNQNYGIEIAGVNDLIRANVATRSNQSGESFSNISACMSCTFIDNHAP